MTTALTERRLTDEERYRRKVAAIVAGLDRTTARQARAALALLADARAQVIADLAQTGGDSGWSSFHLGALRTAIEQAAAEYSRDLGRHVRTSMEQAWAQAVQHGIEGARLLPGSPELSLVGVSRAPLDVALQLTADLVQRVGVEFKARAAREVALAVAGGQTSAKAMAKIADLLRTQPTRHDPRLGSIAYQSERLVRTELLTAYNLAATAMEDQTAEAVPEIRKVWDAAGDIRTRASHASAGRRYAPGSDPGPIPVETDYVVGGEKCRGPHDSRLSAAQRVQCRCISRLWHPEWGR